MAVSRLVEQANLVLKDVPCDASVFVTAVVRVSGGTCFNALADNVANSRAVGFCVKKKTATLCTVVLTGATKDVFTALDDTKDYFLSPTSAGAIQTTAPTGTGQIILRTGRPATSTKMVVMIGNRLQRAL